MKKDDIGKDFAKESQTKRTGKRQARSKTVRGNMIRTQKLKNDIIITNNIKKYLVGSSEGVRSQRTTSAPKSDARYADESFGRRVLRISKSSHRRLEDCILM